MPVSEIAKIGKELADSLASARRLFAVEDEPVPVVDGPGATLALGTNGTGQPLIQYDGVRFAAPGTVGAEAPQLRNRSRDRRWRWWDARDQGKPPRPTC